MRPIDAVALSEGIDLHRKSTDQEHEADRQWAVGYNAGLDRALYSIAYAKTITLPPNDPLTLNALEAVRAERQRQDALWGDQSGRSLLEWVSILGEEYGELCEAVNETCFKNSAHPDRGGVENIAKEATQVAAVALAIIEAVYRHKPEDTPLRQADICTATGRPCCQCKPGPCDSRKPKEGTAKGGGKPKCFYNDNGGDRCLGMAPADGDEPIERCKRCTFCESGYSAEEGAT